MDLAGRPATIPAVSLGRLEPALLAAIDKNCDRDTATALTNVLCRAGLVNLELVSGLLIGSEADFISGLNTYLVGIDAIVNPDKTALALRVIGRLAGAVCATVKGTGTGLPTRSLYTEQFPPIKPGFGHRLSVLACTNSPAGTLNRSFSSSSNLPL